MAKNTGKRVFPRVKPIADNIKSEAAKEFGISGERKNVSSHKGIDNNTRLSAEAQMSGVPVYTKRKTMKKNRDRLLTNPAFNEEPLI